MSPLMWALSDISDISDTNIRRLILNFGLEVYGYIFIIQALICVPFTYVFVRNRTEHTSVYMFLTSAFCVVPGAALMYVAALSLFSLVNERRA